MATDGEHNGIKIAVMAVLLAGACFLTFYYHVVLERGTFFTQLFYIPIILAAIWWRWKGVAVAVFLSALLIASHIFVRGPGVSANDFFRAFAFILVAVVVAWLSEVIARRHGKDLEHLNAVLGAIRNVNQLIVTEKDRDRLIERACEGLIETRGYRRAWIFLLDESGNLEAYAEAGWGRHFQDFVELMASGELAYCMQEAIEQSEVVSVTDRPSSCGDCPLGRDCRGMGTMTIRLESGGRIYGFLSATMPAELVTVDEERGLFHEVAGDIAFALNAFEEEESRRRAEEEVLKFKTISERANYGIAITDLDGNLEYCNEYLALIHGLRPDELTGENISIFHNDEQMEAVNETIRALLETGNPDTFELWHSHRDGSVFPMLMSTTVVKDDDGTPLFMAATAIDITERKRAQEEIRKYKYLVDSTSEAVVLTDAQGVYAYSNDAFHGLFGYKKDELAGKVMRDVILPLEVQETKMPEINGAYREKGYWEGEFAIRRKDGAEVPTSVIASLLKDPSGSTLGRVGLFRDITERKRAEEALVESEGKLSAILKSALDNMSMMDRDHNIVWANDVARRLFGEELVGRKCYAVYHGRDKPCDPCVVSRTFEDRKVQEHETEVTGADGARMMFWCTANVAAWDEEGRPELVVEVSRDITERKRAEETILRNQEELRDLIDVAAHELRHPATIFRGYANILLEHWDSLDEETIKDALMKIDSATDRLTRIVVQFLDTSRIERGKMDLSYSVASPMALINNVFAEAQVKGYENELNIKTPEEHGEIEVDSEKLKNVLGILLENAVTYSPQGSAIDIWFEQDDKETIYHVADRGPGIPEADRERVFERFYQIEDADHHSIPGIGLGLYIAGSIMEAHGGWIKVEPREGGGSIFSFGVPNSPGADSGQG